MIPNLNYDLTARDLSKPAFSSLGRSIDQTETRASRLKGALSGLGASVIKIGAAGAALGVAAIGKAFMSTADAADEMSKAAQKIGVPIEELSRLKYAADLSGVSFESLQTTVGKLSKNMYEAKTGNKEYSEAFAALGVSVTGADGKLKSSSQVMAEMADRFKDMPDGAEKTALAMQLMGKSGADMIPMLNGGADSLNKLLGEADKFSTVFTQEMGSSAELFNDNMSRLQGAFGKVGAEIAGRMLPYMAQFSEWLVVNAPNIANMVSGIIDFGIRIGELAGTLAGWVQSGSQAFTEWWASMLALPDRATAAIGRFMDSVTGLGARIAEAFAALPAQMVEIGGQIMSGLWQGIKSKASSVVDGAVGIASSMVGSIKSRLGIQSPSRVMMEVGENVMAGLGLGMESMEGSIGDVANSIGESIGQAFGSVITGSMKVKDALKQVGKQILSMAGNSVIRSIFGGGSGGGFFSSLIGSIFGGFRANGGGVSAGKSYVVGENGPEIFNPQTSGTITPNNKIGGGDKTVNIYQTFPISGAITGDDVKAMVRQGARAAVGEVRDSLGAWSRELRVHGALA